MHENEVAKVIVDVAYHIHTKLGPGLLESVYEAVMMHELQKRGLHVENQVGIAVEWDGVKLDLGFRADLVVEHCVIVELKSIEAVARYTKDPFDLPAACGPSAWAVNQLRRGADQKRHFTGR